MLARPRLALLASLTCLPLTLSCGGDDSGSSGVTGDVTSESTTTDTNPTSSASSDSAGSSGASSDSTGSSSAGSDTADTSDTGNGPPCSSTADCEPTEYCQFSDNSCGVSGMMGTCEARPSGCQAEERWVCACDGQNYDSVCHAAAAGVDVEFLAKCDVPNGAFACGYSYCINNEEYCLQNGGAMPTFECIGLAPVCGAGNCFCMTDCCGCDNTDCCAGHCDNSTGQTVITCPG